jgi:hypothetical protein
MFMVWSSSTYSNQNEYKPSALTPSNESTRGVKVNLLRFSATVFNAGALRQYLRGPTKRIPSSNVTRFGSQAF